jgi:hypothetical protein
VLRSGRPVHVADRAVQHDMMGCSLMRALPQKLPMQELARNINYGSVALSHVHWASQFKLFRSRQYMPPYLGLHMIEVHPSAHQILQPCRDP